MIQTVQTAPIILGAAIGAGGAVVAQATSAIFTARRESTRLEWEKQRQDHGWELRKQERFLDATQELYASFAEMADSFLRFIDYLVKNVDDSEDERRQEFPDLREMGRLKENVSLMAPEEVRSSADCCQTAILEAIPYLVGNSPASPAWSKRLTNGGRLRFREMQDDMRADRHGPEAVPKRDVQAAVDRYQAIIERRLPAWMKRQKREVM